MKASTATIVAFALTTASYAWALCYNNKEPSFISNCLRCPTCAATLAFLDQQQQAAAYVYCAVDCAGQSQFASCVSCGTYDDVYYFNDSGTCLNNSCINMVTTAGPHKVNVIMYCGNEESCPD